SRRIIIFVSGVRIPAPPPPSSPARGRRSPTPPRDLASPSRRPRIDRKPRPNALYRVVHAALAEPCALPRGSRALGPCSGGPDSVALLHVLADLARPFGLSLAVAHLDHGTRGRAGRADAAFVQRTATALGLPVVVERVDGPGEMAARGWSGEDGLRRL